MRGSHDGQALRRTQYGGKEQFRWSLPIGLHATLGDMRRGRQLLRKVGGRIADLLAPRRCAFCASAGDCVCARCRALLPLNDRACPRCANALDATMPDGVNCGACLARPPLFSRAATPLLYQFPVDTAIKAMKFRRQLFYVPAFAGLLAPLIDLHFSHCDALVPVPLHRFRQAVRGFNQAAELAKGVGRHFDLPVLQCARRVRNTLTQSGLSAEQRQSNLSGAFEVRGALTCRHPLIVDDVITTGHTCNALARVLLEKGVETVSVLAIARAQR